MRGDDLLNEKNLPVPNTYKIDVEGFEFLVLKGFSNTFSSNSCRMICCEIHRSLYPQNITPTEVMDFIKKLGFKKIEKRIRGSEIHDVCTK